MKTILRISVVAVSLIFMFVADLPVLPVQMVSEADAVYGVRRRSVRRGVIIGTAASSGKASSEAEIKAAETSEQ
jgi:hypothetical protein